MTSNDSQTKPATLDDVVTALNKNSDLLEEAITWLRINGYEKVKNLLNSVLDTPEKKLVYQLSDGRSSREIGTAAGVSQRTVSNYWQSWNKRGIMKTQKGRGGGDRYFRAFDLQDYDKSTKSESNAKQEETPEQGQATLNLDVPVQVPTGDNQ